MNATRASPGLAKQKNATAMPRHGRRDASHSGDDCASFGHGYAPPASISCRAAGRFKTSGLRATLPAPGRRRLEISTPPARSPRRAEFRCTGGIDRQPADDEHAAVLSWGGTLGG